MMRYHTSRNIEQGMVMVMVMVMVLPERHILGIVNHILFILGLFSHVIISHLVTFSLHTHIHTQEYVP